MLVANLIRPIYLGEFFYPDTQGKNIISRLYENKVIMNVTSSGSLSITTNKANIEKIDTMVSEKWVFAGQDMYTANVDINMWHLCDVERFLAAMLDLVTGVEECSAQCQ